MHLDDLFSYNNIEYLGGGILSKNPLPLIFIIFLLKENSNFKLPQLNTLEIEAKLDNIKNVLTTIDKFTNISSNITSLPSSKDINQLIQMAGPVISAFTSNNSD